MAVERIRNDGLSVVGEVKELGLLVIFNGFQGLEYEGSKINAFQGGVRTLHTCIVQSSIY